jgi:RNA polymerase sigma-70 factor (ECF subfamily)
MDENDWLAERFEEQRTQLRGVAYRMLGSLAEADDAVQDAWVRVSRAEANDIENFGGWLTTIVARVCLNVLRTRNVRREERISPIRSSAEWENLDQRARHYLPTRSV